MNPNDKPQAVEYIDMTPTWAGMLPAIVRLMDGGSATRNTALNELEKMARAADLWNAHVKAQGDQP